MLFNSYVFVILFLPVTLGVFWWLGRWASRTMAKTWLVIASFFFYGWWNPRYLALILPSVLLNFFLGARLSRAFSGGRHAERRLLLLAGMVLNVGVLGYYKYASFFAENLNALLGTQLPVAQVFLPLGISFFTFQQMAYLVDAAYGKVHEYNLIDYSLFVTFFPQLIAGPIVHHSEVLPQFARAESYRPRASHLSIGVTLFAFGLFKKVVLADGMARYGSPVFTAAAQGVPLTFLEAWGGALAYTLQLYFDFSGYSDMAIGLGRMFGIRLPLNFNSPYKANNIIDFWKRWHITLSRFLKDYLYIPLGGNRLGSARRYFNLMVAMLLGGLWHGAGWTFILWGGLHGLYLVVNHFWRALIKAMDWSLPENMATRCLSRGLTFLAVVVGWVFFRSAGLHAAAALLRPMAGLGGISLPNALPAWLVAAADAVLPIDLHRGGGALANAVFPAVAVLWIGLLLVVVWALPNAVELFARYRPLVGTRPWPRVAPAGWRWRPAAGWALIGLAALGVSLLKLSDISEFLYFQF